jgi:sugar porter (SP) family MFS transporter
VNPSASPPDVAGPAAIQPAGAISGRLLFSTIVASLGGLLFGFDTAVISGTTDSLTRVFELDESWLGFTVASALVGTILGSVLASRPADIWGRKRTLALLAVFYFVSAVGCGTAWDWYSLLAFRLLGGVAVGGASVVGPMYIAEISPARLRGRLVAVMQFNIVLGISLAFLSNYVIAWVNHGPTAWRWMFGIQAFPSAVFFVLLFLTPDTPRWLVARGRPEEARSVLNTLGTDSGSVDQEIQEIQSSLETAHQGGEESLWQRKYKLPISLAVAIAMFNQLSGINAVLYYAPHVFRQAGAGNEAALLQAVAVGGTNLVFTMLAMTVIDRVGRRKLMLAGSIGYIFSLSATAWAFYTYGTNFTTAGSIMVLISLLAFIASHAFGQGAVIWVFISEIFPNRVRARGQALGSLTHWAMATAITFAFPIMAKHSGGHVFSFYALAMVVQLLWVLLVMPETKGVPLEEIQKKLGIE